MVNIENCHTYLLQFLRYAWNFLGQTYDFSLYTGGRRCMNSRLFCGMSPKLGARSSNYTCDDVGFQILKPPRLVCLHDSNTSNVTVLMESCFSQLCGVILSHVQQLVGGLEHGFYFPQ